MDSDNKIMEAIKFSTYIKIKILIKKPAKKKPDTKLKFLVKKGIIRNCLGNLKC